MAVAGFMAPPLQPRPVRSRPGCQPPPGSRGRGGAQRAGVRSLGRWAWARGPSGNGGGRRAGAGVEPRDRCSPPWYTGAALLRQPIGPPGASRIILIRDTKSACSDAKRQTPCGPWWAWGRQSPARPGPRRPGFWSTPGHAVRHRGRGRAGRLLPGGDSPPTRWAASGA